MPSIPDEFVPLAVQGPAPSEPQQDEPGLGEIIGAAGTANNWVYRGWRWLANRDEIEVDPGYDPFSDIKGTRYETDPMRFAFSRSQKETAAIIGEWEDDDQARSVLAKSGWTGTVAGVGMGLVDPTIFFPIAKVFSGAARGASALRIGADVAITGGASAAIGAAVMYGTTPEYTMGDVAFNVGTATLLSGLLGTGAGALISRQERQAVTQLLQEDRLGVGNDLYAPQPQAAGAAASDTRQLQLRSAPVLNKLPDPTAKLSPPRRVLNSGILSARRAVADLVETPYIFEENLQGVATTQGPALSRQVQMEIGRARVAVTDSFDQLYARYRAAQNETAVQRVMRGARDLTAGPAEGKLRFPEFKAEVDKALRSGDVHDIPEVAEAAQLVRRELSTWRDRAIAAKLLPEDVDVATADSYMMRIWDKQKLIGQRPQVVKTFADWLEGEQVRKAEAQERITGISRQLDEASQKVTDLERKAKGGTQAHIDEIARVRALREKLEAELTAWKGKSASEAISAMKARDATPADPAKPRRSGADKAVDLAAKRIMESDRNLSRQEIEARANEIVDRIVGSPDGRLPYEDSSVAPAGGGAPDSARGPLARRAFMIPDRLIQDYLEQDVQKTVEAYLRTMVPDVLLTERFGDVDMTEVFRKMKDEAAAAQMKAPSEAARAKLKEEYDRVVRDVAAMRDRVRHVYGYSSDPSQQFMGRMAATAARFDIITNLGGAALSSLSDLAGMQWRYGFSSVFKNAWAPMLKSLGSADTRKALKEYRSQLKTLGIAAETYLNTRTHGLYDVLDVYAPTSKFERVVNVAADKFGIMNLLTPWTDFTKFAAGMVSGAEITRAVEAVASGKAKPRQIRNLAEGGIDSVMAGRIWQQLQAKGGSNVIDGTRIPNTGTWTDKGAKLAFEGMLARDVDLMILTPGAEKPLMMSRPLGAIILQYKTFVTAANERLLVRSLQARDHQVLAGMASAIALGMLAEYAYSFVANRPTPKDTSDWVKAGVSRSGILGWYQEGNAITSKWTGGAADIFRVIGADMPDARYISRSPGAALLGPVYGKFETTVSSLAKLTSKALGGGQDWKANDTYQLRRLLPAQNLFYIRRLLDAVEDAGNEAIGVEPKARGG
ncbi:MAG: hypothetical protein ACK4M8_05380 [Allorhizobium sp.]